MADQCTRNNPGSDVLEVFVMKKYGEKESWTSLFCISMADGFDYYGYELVSFCGFKDRVVLMLWESTDKTIAYDLKQNSIAYFPIPNKTWDMEAATFVESLASPPSHYKEEEEYPPEGEEYTQISLAGVTSKWKRIHGDFRKNGEVLISLNGEKILVFDPDEESKRYIHIPNIGCNAQVMVYKESMVSPVASRDEEGSTEGVRRWKTDTDWISICQTDLVLVLSFRNSYPYSAAVVATELVIDFAILVSIIWVIFG
ncbi:hypothetical protein RHSIM_Rhsim04G0208800 [Rhododendron simsii]|uniref:F-box associated domain-containing protein n=1 Tax=Rhododendron simsii TaxID=118357 RepID=A0A834H075_RHOSS|nr:hypothetical protein RHSIM_Rhsim04G0208800 [Rhododendron simsii]